MGRTLVGHVDQRVAVRLWGRRGPAPAATPRHQYQGADLRHARLGVGQRLDPAGGVVDVLFGDLAACGPRKPSLAPLINEHRQSRERPVDHIVWVPAFAHEFKLEPRGLDLVGPADPSGVGVLQNSVID